jgi:hypothetical protein
VPYDTQPSSRPTQGRRASEAALDLHAARIRLERARAAIAELNAEPQDGTVPVDLRCELLVAERDLAVIVTLLPTMGAP